MHPCAAKMLVSGCYDLLVTTQAYIEPLFLHGNREMWPVSTVIEHCDQELLKEQFLWGFRFQTDKNLASSWQGGMMASTRQKQKLRDLILNYKQKGE